VVKNKQQLGTLQLKTGYKTGTAAASKQASSSCRSTAPQTSTIKQGMILLDSMMAWKWESKVQQMWTAQ
jgi:hypothetical protein